MNSLNDALAYHWPFPLKHKKPAILKKQTAYRLGVKLPNELDLEIKALSKGSRRQKSFPRSNVNQKVAESRSIIDNFNAHSPLKHRHSGRALGAVPAHNTDAVGRKTKADETATPSSDGVTDDCRLNLSQLRALFPPSTGTPSKGTTAAKLTQCDSPTFCPMNPYRMVYNSTLSSAHLLLNLKRQQELIDRLNSSHQLKNQLSSLAVTSKKRDGNPAKSEMTLNSTSHPHRHVNMPALRSLCYMDRTPANHQSSPPPHPTLSQALGWHSKSEVLQLPEVDSTINTTASEAAVNITHQETTPVHMHIPRPSRRAACKHHKKSEPVKYADPWKGGGRLYKKRLTDLATMVTETLIWEKSKQYKKTKGSSSALFSNN